MRIPLLPGNSHTSEIELEFIRRTVHSSSKSCRFGLLIQTEMADNASAVGPKSTFEAYRAEGDMLFKQQEFRKALESYNQVSA